MSEKGWDVVPLRAVAADGGLFVDGDWVESKDQDPNGEIRLTQLADVGDSFFLDKSDRWINKDKFHELRCTEILPGDILIARMPDPIARSAILPKGLGYSVITVVDVAILRAGTGWNNRYVMWAINSSDFRNDVDSKVSGSTRQRISRSALGRTKLRRPPLETQQRIADYLDRETAEIDAAVSDLDRYVELMEKRKWQQLNEILESSPHSKVRLSVAAKMKTGTTPSNLIENEEGVPWLKPDGLGVQSTGQRIDFEMLGESLLSPGGTTYVCGIGSIGKVGYSEEPSITNQQITALTPVINVIPKLFYFSVLTLTDWLRGTAPGSTIQILNNTRLGTYSVRIPDLDVQQTVLAEIESLFHETDQIITESTRLRDLLIKRRSVLITEVVTGQRKV